MLTFLPAIAFCLLVPALRLRLQSRSWREACLVSAVALGVLTVFFTEGISQASALGATAVVAYWAVICAAAAALLLFPPGSAGTSAATPREESSWIVRLLFGGVALYLVTTFVIAVVSPPNTWDVMEYHLPKVMHWIQDRSVAFYPTAIPRQNHLAPGAEFAVMHLYLLSGSDRFSNLVEWCGMAGSLLVVSRIARQLGAGLLGQTLAAVFAVTLPMGLMQATSTQTDYVVAFWFVCFVHFLLRLRQAETFRWPVAGLMAGALGLAVFTKATAYLFAPTFLVWFACWLMRRHPRRAIGGFAACTVVFLAINIGPYARNWQVYGHPLGPRREPNPNTIYSVESHAPAALASSLAKHVSTHINTPWPQANAAIQRGYVALHQWIGWDINDPRTSWGPSWVRFAIGGTDFLDENDGNPVHFLLGALCGALALFVPTLRRDRTVFVYALAVIGGFLLFAFYLKWHPWMSRLHHGLFVAASPLVGVVLTRTCRQSLTAALAGTLLIAGLPWLLFCQQRPLVGRNSIFRLPREQLYFTTPHQNYRASFLAGKEYLRDRSLSRVGLIVENSSWEYMWWVLLRHDHPHLRLEHVNVEDPSQLLTADPRFRDFQPEALITLDRRRQPEKLTIGQVTYTRAWQQGHVEIYLKD